jgi:N utilization substance protein B
VSGSDARRPARDRAAEARIRGRRAGRRLALASVFEAEFGQRTADAILERHLALEGDPEAAALAREIVANVVAHRDTLDARITAAAPQYPVVQLARMDRALLRCGLCEVLHSPATPARVAIAEWVELARTYSGEPMRRLVNGVLGRIARESNATRQDTTQAPGGSQWPARTSG